MPDSSPLILLGKLERVHLLARLYGKVVVTPTVWQETVTKGKAAGARDAAYLEKVALENQFERATLTAEEEELVRRIGEEAGIPAGEAEVLAITMSRTGLAILDDKGARALAFGMGVAHTGTAGLVSEAFLRRFLNYCEEMAMRWDIYLITDPEHSRGLTLSDVITQAVCAGVDVVELRDTVTPLARLTEIGRIVREITRSVGSTLIVADRVDVAMAIDADGVHVWSGVATVSAAKGALLPGKLVGASVRNVEGARRAEKAGANYLIAGPVFATSTDLPRGKPIGLAALPQIKKAVSIPVLAGGGIDADNADEVIRNGADGVAVASAIVSSPDIPQAVRGLRSAIEAARSKGS